jgi:serine/threonine-protein kinase RsbW
VKAEESDTLSIEFPPIPAYVGTARLFVAAAARHFEVEEERVEDLKVAVSEACTTAIRVRASAAEEDPVRVVVRTDAGALTVEVPGAPQEASDPEDSTTGDLVRSLGVELIRSLFPEAASVDEDGFSGIRFSVPRP